MSRNLKTFSIQKDKLKELISHHKPKLSEATTDMLIDEYANEYQTRIAWEFKLFPKDLRDFFIGLLGIRQGIGLTSSQSKAVKLYIGTDIDNEEFMDNKITSVTQLANQINAYRANKAYNYYHLFMGKKIPIKLKAEATKTQEMHYMNLNASIETMDGFKVEVVRQFITHGDLFDELEVPIYDTVQEFLNKLEIYTEPGKMTAEEYFAETEKYTKLIKTREVYAHYGTALKNHDYKWFSSTEPQELGTKDIPVTVITECELEKSENNHRYYYGYGGGADNIILPLIRVFSFAHKSYFWAWAARLKPVQWDTEALTKLVLPTQLKKHVLKLFSTEQKDFGSDILKGKTPGLIILASGGPGTGKTATAEAYSQHAQRPLYILETAELGTNPNELEERLTKILIRIQRWNAILLMDEVDIFFSKRGDDLNRSAIVGIFLRVIDQFAGFLFLTTNRPEVIDPAFLSRVVMELHYPDLDEPSRLEIWNTFIEIANINLKDPANLPKLAKIVLNGRQIRNKARLAKILYDGDTITVKQIIELCTNH